jgi:hypothetical protein
LSSAIMIGSLLGVPMQTTSKNREMCRSLALCGDRLIINKQHQLTLVAQ